jgi:hypothetical protein
VAIFWPSVNFATTGRAEFMTDFLWQKMTIGKNLPQRRMLVFKPECLEKGTKKELFLEKLVAKARIFRTQF